MEQSAHGEYGMPMWWGQSARWETCTTGLSTICTYTIAVPNAPSRVNKFPNEMQKCNWPVQLC